MGSYIEFNDTLQLTTEQGFPKELILEKHLQHPFTANDFAGRVFSFQNKPRARLFHLAPTRVLFVHNIDGKWLYWGHAHIIEQTIDAKTETTSGKFVITQIYTPEHQKSMSMYEVDDDKKYLF